MKGLKGTSQAKELEAAFFLSYISNNNTHCPANLLILQPCLPSPIHLFSILHYSASIPLHTFSRLAHLNDANPVDMSLVSIPWERSTLSSSKAACIRGMDIDEEEDNYSQEL